MKRKAKSTLTGSSAIPASGTGAVPAAGSRSDAWFTAQWTALAAAVAGEPVSPDAKGTEIVTKAAHARALASLAEAVARGVSLETAVCRAVSDLALAIHYHAAFSLAEGVARWPGGATASSLGHAVLLHRRRQFDRAWRVVRELDDTILAEHIPIEAVDAAFAAGTHEGRDRALAVGIPSGAMPERVLVDLAGRFLAMGERARAAELVAELRRRPVPDLDGRRRYAWTLIEGWLDPKPVAVPVGAIPVGIIDYQAPDPVLTSGNLGDYIQTLGLLGTLARLTDVTFTGEDGLGAVATDLRGRIPEDLRVPGVTGAMHLVPVDRDFSAAAAIPDGTWMVAFGWHMHPLFDLRYDFPYNPKIRPLFVSFHVNRLDLLSDEALDYLRDHGPVGCRDWNTVHLLLSAGVDAFFSGCLTTTVDALFPSRETAYAGKGAVGVIDLPASAAGKGRGRVKTYSHQSDAYRYMSVTEGVRAADAALGGYQRDLDRAITGRLHAYLPLTSLGVPVEFRTRSPGDVRFAGLTHLGAGDTGLAQIRDGLRSLIADAFATILSGAGEAAVYARWRELTADRVAEARRRFEAPVADSPTTIDIAAAVASAKAASRRFGPHESVDRATVSDVVIAFDQNLTYPAAVLVESMVANTAGPLRLWVLARGLGDPYFEWLASAFPELPMTILPCDGITYQTSGPKRRIPSRITVSTMDRLLLPAMLEDVRRVVYIDIDTLVLDDVRTLARMDLGGHPVAARDSNVSEASEWQRAGRPLDEPLATELRRAMGRLHGYGHPALNAGVLVMDLDRMRADDFTSRYLGFGERYGLHDQDTMLAYVGAERAVIDPGWNAMPVLEDVSEPHLIHWASFPKPWDPELTFEQPRWQGYAASLRTRAGMPPEVDDGTAARPGSLRNPVEVGQARAALSPAIEKVIDGVREEHLSYLDVASLRTLAATIAEVEAAGIEGLVVECGTARGGSAITLAAAKATGRPMRVYDVFGMIPPPSEKDGKDVHRRYATIVAGESKGIGGDTYYGYLDDLLAEVTGAFARYGYPVAECGVSLIQGRFEDTIEGDEPVAFAHLDGDWYASTMTCLTRLAPRLVPGGRIVLDDYDTWSGCRNAVHEYFAGRPGFRFERRGRLHVVRL
ncbi:MAG TPA: TylF/MycF/NovP-related O-methyltransferase [Candidatus Limnocylindrales bacterium]|nr:TylF/MycF/NovP-related O-methyltransferase [Candidatus Limnocylindrales bacterium]